MGATSIIHVDGTNHWLPMPLSSRRTQRLSDVLCVEYFRSLFDVFMFRILAENLANNITFTPCKSDHQHPAPVVQPARTAISTIVSLGVRISPGAQSRKTSDFESLGGRFEFGLARRGVQ